MNTIFSVQGGIGLSLIIIGTILFLCTRLKRYCLATVILGSILYLPVTAVRITEDACTWNYLCHYVITTVSIINLIFITLQNRKDKEENKEGKD